MDASVAGGDDGDGGELLLDDGGEDHKDVDVDDGDDEGDNDEFDDDDGVITVRLFVFFQLADSTAGVGAATSSFEYMKALYPDLSERAEEREYERASLLRSGAGGLAAAAAAAGDRGENGDGDLDAMNSSAIFGLGGLGGFQVAYAYTAY
jgi:hypothetical protein